MTNEYFKSYRQLKPEDKALSDLLCSGSDERSVLGSDGLNKYGGAPYPRPTIAFGSCTSSTISPRGWEAVRLAWESLQKRAEEVGELQAADEMGQEIQARLLWLMELADIDGLKLVLTPSGSDAESVALFFAALSNTDPLVNIVVGAREVGSGTVMAAGARYFSVLTPAGKRREPGSVLDASLAERTCVHQVKIRAQSAAERMPDDLDHEIKQLVDESLESQARVIVHIVAHSKTGVHAPRLETMNELVSRHGERIVPIIDAAQGRFSRRGLHDYLSRGFMVILTGSKFYGGPPFSGCLLIPKNLLPQDQSDIRFPPGLSDYLTPAQLPADWKAGRESLSQATNLGLLLRWEAAIEEMRAYYDTPDVARYRILRFFESQAPIILGRGPLLELINVPTPVFEDSFERLLESKTTVYSFRVKARDNRQCQLDPPALARWVRWMNRDISAVAAQTADGDILEATRTCFQLGQSVHVGELQNGEQDHVIRVAIGGVLITEIASNLSFGPNLDARLAWLGNQLEHLRLKLEFIAEHEAALLAMDKVTC